MKLTLEKPTRPGWYWMKDKTDDAPRVVYVRVYDGQMAISNWAIPDSALWYGPLQEPE